MLIESHAHLSHGKFDGAFRYLNCGEDGECFVDEGDRASLMEEMKRHGIGAVIEPAIDVTSNRLVFALADRYPGYVFPAAGLHPTRAAAARWKDRGVPEEYAGRGNTVAIGETGLDFHRPRGEQHRLRQLRWFLFQIFLAHRHALPLILHLRGRSAERLALAVLRLCRPWLHGGVAHCFHGDLRMAEALIGLGFALGIGGMLLQNGGDSDVLCGTVKSVPIGSILLETDSPYVHPACEAVSSGKKRAKIRNTPMTLKAVAAGIAELKGMEVRDVERITAENAVRVFALPVRLPPDGE